MLKYYNVILILWISAMRPIKHFIFLLTIIFSLAVQAESDSATAVRKTVENGKVVFSQSGFSSKKPAKKSEPEKAQAPKPVSTAPKVDIYYASWDPYSNKAIMFFRENHIVVSAYDIDLDPEAAARKKKIDPSFVGMPLVIVNGVVIRGVDEKKYQEALSLTPK